MEVVPKGWFPQEHIYTDINRNYYVIVTANYGPIQKENTRVFVRFVPPEITQIPIPSEITVTIPDYQMILGTRLYNVSGEYRLFEDSFFERYISSFRSGNTFYL